MAEATANSRGADQVRGMPKKPPLGEREARLIAESIPHIVWMAAADGSSTYFNQRGTAYTGCPDGEALGLSWLNFIHAGDAEPAGRDWEHAFETNTEFAFECRIRRHDGVYRWHSVRSLPVHGEDGNTLFWIGTATDIDHQKRLESSLRTSRQQAIETLTLLESIGRAEPVGVGYVDRNLRVVRLNRQLERFSSLPLEEQIGRTLAELRPELWPQIADIYDRALHGETVVNVEISAADPDHGGETSYYLYSCYPVGIDGRIIGVGNVVTDVTRLKKAEDSLARNLDAMVHAIGRTVEYRDPYTAGHQERVAALAAAMAVELDLSPSSVEGVKTAASIHDIGKIAIPAEILSKPGKLLPSEFELIKQHCNIGYDIVSGLDFPWPVAEMILQHHERLDGSGYPQGLGGEDITIEARIIAVADVVEAMVSHRPYRPAHGVDDAIDFITSVAGRTLDARAVRTCVDLVRSGRVRLVGLRLDSPPGPPSAA